METGEDFPVPEKTSKDFILYKSNTSGVTIKVPNSAKIPLNEGLHIQISDGHDEGDSPKETLSRLLFGLEAAKVTAESGLTQDAWANTRIEKGNKVSVYGRIATEKDSWRKPVNTNNRNAPVIDTLAPNYDQVKLTRLFQKYTPKWENLLNNMTLFDNGVGGKDAKTVEGNYPVIWENERFKVDIVRKYGHLEGYHLVVHPKEEFFNGPIKRQWQTVQETKSDIDEQRMVQIYVQATLEATSIAMGIQELLAKGQGEIHNSGNWAPALKSIEEGGVLNLENLQNDLKGEKRRHRPDLVKKGEELESGKAEDFATSMHVHVYIPEKESDPVVLPVMSLDEAKERGNQAVIDQWEKIPYLTQEKVNYIITHIGGGKLSKWLTDNVSGKLASISSS